MLYDIKMFDTQSPLEEILEEIESRPASAFKQSCIKRMNQKVIESKKEADRLRANAFLTTLTNMKGSTILPSVFLNLPLNVQNSFTIGRNGKFITILN